MDKKGVMLEEWKGRRKEWKKKRWKKGKGKKWFWEKSFFVFVDHVFESSLFSLHPPHHHVEIHPYTHHPLHTTIHWCTLSHATGLCAVLPFFFFTNKFVSFCQSSDDIMQTHSPWREKWGLSHNCPEEGLKKR